MIQLSNDSLHYSVVTNSYVAYRLSREEIRGCWRA